MRASLDRICARKAIESWVNSHGSVKFGWDSEHCVTMMLDDALSADVAVCSDDPTGSTSLIWCRATSWDSKILGVRVGRFSFISTGCGCEDDYRASCVSQFLVSAREQFGLLIGRLDSRDVADLNVMEEHGFRVMDSLVTLTRSPVAGVFDPSVRLWNTGDTAVLEEIGRQSFRTDHYHADSRLSPAQCDQLYSQWVRNACNGRAAAVLVVEVAGETSGFITCMLDPKDVSWRRSGSIDLIAIAPDKRGRGLGKKLVSSALTWFHEQGIECVEVGTQISNISAVRLYEYFGFRCSRSAYTIHGWLDVQSSPKEAISHA